MVDRTNERERLFAKIGFLTDVEVAELLDYVTIMETMRVQLDAPSRFEDELVAMLAESRESQRARTVVEWERVRQRAERTAFAAAPRYPV